MYHYILRSAEGGGRLLRDPATIREELGGIRTLLTETEASIKTADRKKEALLVLLEGGLDTPPYLSALAEVVDESERLRRRMDDLLERTDLLGSELSDTLLLLRGYSV
jgi:hypothetical protein